MMSSATAVVTIADASEEEVLLMFTEIAKNDSFTITKTTLKSGIFTSPYCKFTFSSLNMASFSSKSMNRSYTEALARHILDTAPVITVVVQDLNYANATKLIQALKKRNKLSEFYIGATAARSFRFIHITTSAFPKDPDRLLRFIQATKLQKDDPDIDTYHTFEQCEDPDAVDHVLRELRTARPSSVHVAEMLSALEEVQDEEHERFLARFDAEHQENEGYLQDFRDATLAAAQLRDMENVDGTELDA